MNNVDLSLMGGAEAKAIVANADVLKALNALNQRAGAADAYVTETYNSGSTKRRVWSDGFIEQWFHVSSDTYNNSGKTISLNRAFSSTNYHVSVIPLKESGAPNEFGIYLKSKATSSFSLACAAWDLRTQTFEMMVYASGY